MEMMMEEVKVDTKKPCFSKECGKAWGKFFLAEGIGAALAVVAKLGADLFTIKVFPSMAQSASSGFLAALPVYLVATAVEKIAAFFMARCGEFEYKYPKLSFLVKSVIVIGLTIPAGLAFGVSPLAATLIAIVVLVKSLIMKEKYNFRLDRLTKEKEELQDNGKTDENLEKRIAVLQDVKMEIEMGSSDDK